MSGCLCIGGIGDGDVVDVRGWEDVIELPERPCAMVWNVAPAHLQEALVRRSQVYVKFPLNVNREKWVVMRPHSQTPEETMRLLVENYRPDTAA
jgi:hypothetical protein